MSDNLRIRKVDCKRKLFVLLALFLLFPAGLSFAAREKNKIVSMRMESSNGALILRIVTEKPIADFAHTAYSSGDLSRVVVAFPRMDTGAVSSLGDVNQPPVQKVEVLSGNTTWGRMGWVEVVLSKGAEYDVSINYNELVLTLLQNEEQAKTAEVASGSKINEPVAASISGSPEKTKRASVVVPAFEKEVATPASQIMNVALGAQVVTLQANGFVDNFKFFSLGGPDRLVVDVFGVKPSFKTWTVPLSGAFSQIRVGIHKEKLRFVFDSSGKLPKYAVTRKGDSIVIRWGSGTSLIAVPLLGPPKEMKRASVTFPVPKKKERIHVFSKEYLSGKTLYVVSFVEDDSSMNNAVISKEVFNADGTVDITHLSNQYKKTVTYGVTKAGLLFYGSNVTEGSTITCSTEHYINTDFTIKGVFDSVGIYFFEEERAVNFANTLFNSIPQGCL